MTPDTTPTPRTEIYVLNPHPPCVPADFARQLERELAEKTNEVARLRELLNRAIDNCECEPKCSSHFASYCDCGRYARNEEIRKELAQLAPAPEEAVDKGEISDGFHTFNELYDHRCTLFLALLQRVPSMSWISKKHDDGSSFDGWFIAGMKLPTGDVTYHLPEKMWNLAVKTGAEQRTFAPKWDGHKSPDVVNRLQAWIELVAPAPEEPTHEGITMDEWYGGFTKIESTEPVVQNSRTTESDPVPTQQPTQNEWRELGKDEVICEGDEEMHRDGWIWFPIAGPDIGLTPSDRRNYSFRTRRPLPKQERPLEKELKRIEWYQNYSEATIYHALADAIRYLRDEIETLKKNQK